MPAAKPSRATLNNLISAAAAKGLTPTAMIIGADGSVRLEFLSADQLRAANGTTSDESPEVAETVEEDDVPPKWGQKKKAKR